MSRPKYKELFLKEKAKKGDLKEVLKQYRNLMSFLTSKRIINYKVEKSSNRFCELDVISFSINRQQFKYVIARECYEEDE